jgi:hypothetical protein
MSSYAKTAISYIGLKESLLYFPQIICLSELLDIAYAPVQGRPGGGLETLDFFMVGRLKKLANGELLPPELRTSKFIQARQEFEYWLSKYAPAEAKGQPTDEFVQHMRDAWQELSRLYADFGRLPVISDPKVVVGESQERREDLDVSLTVASLNLIDVRGCAWDQLIEFRKDDEAMNKLRRFRLFIYEKYSGKTKDFIEDDILTRAEDYQRSVKKWGFTTATGSISTLLNSTLVAGGIAGLFVSAYLQAPIPAIASIAGATGLTIANMAIHLGKQKFERADIIVTNPVSYISYAQEKLQGAE